MLRDTAQFHQRKDASAIPSASDQAVWPWQAEPYRLWSLLEIMEPFYPAYLFARAVKLGALIHIGQKDLHRDSVLDDEFRQRLIAELKDGVERDAAALGDLLTFSSKSLESLTAALASPTCTIGEATSFYADYMRRVQDEMSMHLFLRVRSEDVPFYRNPLEGWDKVIDRFGCSFDIEEARKCLALERSTACVFHLMRVTEHAVLELQMFLKAPDVNAHFGSVLRKLEQMTQRTEYSHLPAHLKSYRPFMEDVLAQLHAVKDSWRDKASHVDSRIVPSETFTPELAKGVHDATLLLMKKLASGLPPASV